MTAAKGQKLEGWATARGQQIVSLVVLCRRHADELRGQLPELRAQLRPIDCTLFRVRHRAFVREFIETSPGCGQCAVENGRGILWSVDKFALTRDEMAAEGATA